MGALKDKEKWYLGVKKNPNNKTTRHILVSTSTETDDFSR